MLWSAPYFLYFITSRYFEYYQIKNASYNSDISNPVNLQQCIDNRDGCKRVGLKSFTYCWGWYNIHNEVIKKQGESPVRIPPGYYSFQQLADIFRDHKISMSVSENSGRVSLSTISGLKISKRLKSMLGLHVKGGFSPNHTCDEPLDFAVMKSLYVHLSDINESYNFHNGPRAMYLLSFPLKIKALVILWQCALNIQNSNA